MNYGNVDDKFYIINKWESNGFDCTFEVIDYIYIYIGNKINFLIHVKMIKN